MKRILIYSHQLPQNLVGVVLRLFYPGKDSQYEDAIVRRSAKMKGGISLGQYIIVSSRANRKKSCMSRAIVFSRRGLVGCICWLSVCQALFAPH